MSTFWAMSIAHSFMSILIHRAGFMSIARYEFYDNIGSMYELCSYYDSGFIMDELCSYISCMTFIMIPIPNHFANVVREVKHIVEGLGSVVLRIAKDRRAETTFWL